MLTATIRSSYVSESSSRSTSGSGIPVFAFAISNTVPIRTPITRMASSVMRFWILTR